MTGQRVARGGHSALGGARMENGWRSKAAHVNIKWSHNSYLHSTHCDLWTALCR
jgi:hypothetical protein